MNRPLRPVHQNDVDWVSDRNRFESELTNAKADLTTMKESKKAQKRLDQERINRILAQNQENDAKIEAAKQLMRTVRDSYVPP